MFGSAIGGDGHMRCGRDFSMHDVPSLWSCPSIMQGGGATRAGSKPTASYLIRRSKTTALLPLHGLRLCPHEHGDGIATRAAMGR